MIEIRCEVPNEAVAVLDGFCQATGKSRSDVIRQLLSEWSETKLRESILVCRVAGVNPTAPERNRGISKDPNY